MVRTAIFKEPVYGPVPIRRLGLVGDGQADRKVHGGMDKAIYVFPGEHYAAWRPLYPDRDWRWGMFGENLTTEGLDELTVAIGDVFRIGTAVAQVTQPRLPCAKLGVRFNDAAVVKRFLRTERTGFYLRVLEQGVVKAGDTILGVIDARAWPVGADAGMDDTIKIDTVTRGSPSRVLLSDAIRIHTTDRDNTDLLQRVLEAVGLSDSWRSYAQKRLEKIRGPRRT